MNDGIDFEGSRPGDAAAAAPGTAAGAATATCVACGQEVRERYWEANGKIACEACKTRIDARAPAGSPFSRFAVALLLGTLAALLGAAVWWAVARFAHLEAALIAIGIGWLVGHGVRVGAQSRGGIAYQLLAVVLTYLSIVLAYAALILGELGDRSEWPIAVVMAFVAPFLGGWSSLLSILIIGFGLYQAWRTNRPLAIEWSGPYRVPAPSSGPPPLPQAPAP